MELEGLKWCLQGGGSVARVLHHYFPQVHMVGWELDPAVLAAARLCMGLDLLEKSGRLVRGSFRVCKFSAQMQAHTAMQPDNIHHAATKRVAEQSFP